MFVFARIFDTNTEKWSVHEFGKDGGSQRLLGKVVADFSPTMWQIYFPYDRTTNEVPKNKVYPMTELYDTLDGKLVRKLTAAQRRELQSLESETELETEESEDEEEVVELDRNVQLDWTEGTLVEDTRTQQYYYLRPILTRNIQHYNDANVSTSLIWLLFNTFFPMAYVESVVLTLTNGAASGDPEWWTLKIGEFLRYLGLICYMLTHKVGGKRRNYWNKTGDGVFPPADFYRFMPMRRFELITKYLTLGDNGDEGDRMRYWRGWIEAVRVCFVSAMKPGRELVADETMIENKNYDKARVHLTFIPRKPCPHGYEFKTVVDCESGCLVNFELNEGKEIMREKEFVREYKATAAQTLRLMLPYRGSFRTVYIDSWFQSVLTATQLLILLQIYSIGIVKTANRNYPKESLEARCPEEAGALSGSYITISEGNHPPFVLQAVQWRSSSKHKLTLCTTASSSKINEANPYVQSTSGRKVPQPQMVLDWYTHFGGVDAFNHTKVGKGKNGWEHHLKVQNKPDFPLFTGMMSMIDANIFNAMKYFFPEAHGDTTHTTMRQMLCFALINNPHYDPTQIPNAPPPPPSNVHNQIFLGNNKRRRCVVCSRMHNLKSLTDLHCGWCGPDSFMCRDSPERQCWSYHVKHGVPKRTRKRNADEMDL